MGARDDFGEVNKAALNASERLLGFWLPDGKRVNGEWVAPNPTRSDHRAGSFSINLRTGVWADFATDDKGSDLISLYAYINGCGQVDAMKAIAEQLAMPLDQTPRQAPAVPRVDKPAKTEWVPVVPAPADAAALPAAHVVRGKPEKVWRYLGAAGELLGAVYRFKTSDGGKEICPLVYARHPSGRSEWRWQQWPVPRPLYGLDRLALLPDSKVLLVEGEKCADVAQELFPATACVTWSGGSKAIDKVDWSPLAGREVVIWPDADSQRERVSKAEKDAGVDPASKPYVQGDQQPGMKAALLIAAKLGSIGAAVRLVALPEPGMLADGWDIADAVQVDGWDAARCKQFIADNLIEAKAFTPLEPASAGHGANPPPAQAESWGQGPDERWQDSLLRTDKGALQAVLANAYLILSHDFRWAGVLAYDEFAHCIVKRKAPPFSGGVVGAWSDADASKTLVWLQMCWGMTIKYSSVADEAARMVARDNTVHPPREWLNSLPEWVAGRDPELLPSMLSDIFGAEQNDYTAHVGTGMLVSAVARVMEPGCKVDTMLVFESTQGKGKSTAIHDLVGAHWYVDNSDVPGSKDFLISLQGAWVTEIGEMQSFSRAEIGIVKQMITRRDDKFRAPYERHSSAHPRQGIFAGTSNNDSYLRDPTGGRRFLPVKCGDGPVNLAAVRQYRDLYWAEALAKYKAGFAWWEYPRDLAEAEQEARYEADSWTDNIVRYLEGQVPAEWYPRESAGRIMTVTVSELLSHALRIEVGKHNRPEQTRIGAIMIKMGWRKVRGPAGAGGYRPWLYQRPPEEAG